jgi:enhancer of yellow 2 transcription factor
MADSQEERLKRDEQIRETIMAKLVESGEKDKLKEMLRERLVQCGWRDELKEHCKDIIRRKGLEKVTVEELVAEITPHGRCKLENCGFDSCIYNYLSSTATVPEDVKTELLKRIRLFLQST